jgi:hypothetical protein
MHARSPYRLYTSTGNLPSGLTIEDYYVYIRNKMYVILNQRGALPAAVEVPMNDTNVSHCCADLSAGVVGIGDVVNQQETDIDINATTANQSSATSTDMTATEAASWILDQEESAMPDSWIFPGFIIFALLRPIVPPELLQYRVELLMTSTPDIPCNTDLAHAEERKKRRRAKGRSTAQNAVALEMRGGSKTTTASSNSSRHSTAGLT